MSEPKFTKGPWRYEVASGTVEADQYITVCDMDIGCSQDEIEENIANAHLIASAPDLYETLKHLIIGIGMGVDLTGAVDAARAALAKARGEAQ